MTTTFLHGVEVLQIDTGARPIQTVRSSVIGIVGTAPDADAAKFPLNTPVLIASRSEMAGLGTTGTLQSALDLIYDQAGAVVVVVRVAQESTEAATIDKVVGGINGTTGGYEGVHAFLAAENAVGFSPRILIAPGFTHQRTSDGILSIAVQTQGAGYTTAPPVTAPGGAVVRAVLGTGANAGKVVSFVIEDPGKNVGPNPTITIGAPPSGGVQAVAGTVQRGTVRSEVLAELLGIANRLRSRTVLTPPTPPPSRWLVTSAAVASTWSIPGSCAMALACPRRLLSLA
jgi:phage tail sheath protein FI